MGAAAGFACDREAGAVVVEPVGDVEVVAVVGRAAPGGALGGFEQCPAQQRGALMGEMTGRALSVLTGPLYLVQFLRGTALLR
jgi:hypothetical protein